jgi:polysaccharide biosynthesis transport protein
MVPMDGVALEYAEYRRDLRDYVTAINRRRLPMLAAAGIMLVCSVLLALFLPPVYRSAATILIEEQEIPQDLVRTTISSYADQRIQVISQQVMTRATLMQVVEKYGLYSGRREKETSEEILARMRKDIKLDLVNADVVDRRSGSKTTATIAFTLSYDGETAEKAQKVANELTSLYLNENLQIRQQKVAETSSFLEAEADSLGKRISDIERKLATFKLKNIGRLPELSAVNIQMRDRAEAELSDVDRQVASVEERRFYLEAQLAQIKPNTPIVSSSGERILDPEDHLRALRAQYAGMAGLYSEGHPDMVRARKQIKALEAEVGQDSDRSEEGRQLGRLKTDLATMLERYSEDHPDVSKLRARIAALETSITAGSAVAEASRKKPENPAYLTLQAQLESLKSEARSAQKRRAELRSRLGELESRLESTPLVERDYLELTRDHENAVVRYRETKAKLMEAQVAQNLEKDRKSERFSLIDPPQFPEKPRSPNRPAILVIGLLLSIGGGISSVAVLETMDKSIRSPRELSHSVNVPLLAVIPRIATASDVRAETRRVRLVAVAAVAAVVAALLAVHLGWMPLEVVWYSLLRRLGLG